MDLHTSMTYNLELTLDIILGNTTRYIHHACIIYSHMSVLLLLTMSIHTDQDINRSFGYLFLYLIDKGMYTFEASQIHQYIG